MKETLQDRVRNASKFAEKIYEGAAQDYEHMPMALVRVGGEFQIIGLMLDTPDWRVGVRHLFEKLAAQGASEILHVHECWATSAPTKKDADDLLRGRRVSELPPDDRREVLMIEAIASNGERAMAMRPIVRGHGRVSLGEIEVIPHDPRSTSVFFDNLPWRKPRP